MDDVKTLRRIEWCRAELDSVQGIFLNFLGSPVAMKAIACASSCISTSFFCRIETEIMHRHFAVPPFWADSSTLPKDSLTQLDAPSTFPTESLFVQFCIIQSTLPGKEALRVKGRQILWNLSSTPVLPRYTRAASMKAWNGSPQQHACFKAT